MSTIIKCRVNKCGNDALPEKVYCRWHIQGGQHKNGKIKVASTKGRSEIAKNKKEQNADNT